MNEQNQENAQPTGYRRKPYHKKKVEAYRNAKRKPPEYVRRNPATMWQRIQERTQWGLDELCKIGLDPHMGTSIGKLFVFEVLTKRHVDAAELYSEIAGRYSRFHVEGRRSAASPAFQRGFRGYDNEVQRHSEDGTIKHYERRARSAKNMWLRVQRCIPTSAAKELVDRICLDNQDIPSSCHDDLKVILERIAKEFFGK